MRNYTWLYGIFHWIVHYLLAIMPIAFSGIVIFPIYASYNFFGVETKINIADYFLAIAVTSLMDLDHFPVLKKFGFKKAIFAQKRIISPLHNFFSLSALSIVSAFFSIFISKTVGVLIFIMVLHMVWDIFEDVLIFRTSFRRWEKTWGLNKKDLEDAYNELLQIEPQQEKKKSRIKRTITRIKEKIRRRKELPKKSV